MEEVRYSKEGITKNILSLNYDESQSIIEYINNVILKNNDPNYEFSLSQQKEVGVYFGVLWSYNSNFRILLHLQPYVLGFYWRF